MLGPAIDPAMGGKRGSKSESTFQQRLLALGKLLILVGTLMAVGLSSAYLGMRVAVRGAEVEVPGLKGRSVEEVRGVLERLNLKAAVIGERFDPVIPRGAVISQYPRAGGRLKAERTVQLLVSLGEKHSPVPDLKGSTLRVARLLAAQAGYELGHISQIPLAGTDRDVVLQQLPPPHSEETVSNRIDVLISGGSDRTVIMPDVTGMGINRAMLLFEHNSFRIASIQYRPYPGVARGTVVKQFPEPGYMLTPDNPINLEVVR